MKALLFVVMIILFYVPAFAVEFELLTQGQGRYPDWSSDGSKIVFESDRVTSYEIWVIQSTGGIEQQLTFILAHHRCPNWSPDGQLIAFTSNRDHVSAIYQMSPLGENIKKITLDQNNYTFPDWSPDGTEIAFASNLEGKEGIWVLSYIDGQERQLTYNIGYYPDWSPDGEKIAYMGGDANIWVVPAEGGTPIQITNDPAWERHPSWSPDGNWIAFTLQQLSKERDVWLVSSNGSTLIRLTSDGSWNYEPTWSPDGTKIAFVSNRDGISKIWIASDLPVQVVGTSDKSWGEIKNLFFPNK